MYGRFWQKTSEFKQRSVALSALLAFGMVCGLAASGAGAVSKEDPATTAMMRDQISPLRKAYTAKDSKAYATAIAPLFIDAMKQAPTDLVKRYASLELLAANEGLDGIQPMVYRYAMSMFKAGSKIDPQTISQLRASLPLAQSTINSGLAVDCASVVRNALTGNLPGLEDLAGLTCLMAEPEIHGYTLTTQGIMLPTREACELLYPGLVYRLDIPTTIASASINSVEVLNLPFPGVLTSFQDWANKRWVSISPVQFGGSIPAYAQTETFTIRLNTTTGPLNYPVTLPINFNIHVDCSSTTIYVGIGDTLNLPVYGNGPRAPRVWAAGPGFPAGLSAAPGTGSLAGHDVVTGTVQPSAVNGAVTFAFTQGTTVVSRSYGFQVALRADQAVMNQLSAPQNIVRGQAISLQLPSASGATGTYTWTIGSTGAPLPAGLNLVRNNNNNWVISGTVANTATLDRRFVKVVLSSGQQAIIVTMTFDARVPLNVYTQNMILFPPSIADPVVDCLPAVAWPPAYGACIAALQLAQTTFYNASPLNPDGIHNTDADNRERSDMLINFIGSQFDVVTLQEVWDGPLTTAELEHIENQTNPSYRAIRGPDNHIALVPPDFKLNSGLLTLVKRPTFTNPPSPSDQVESFSTTGDSPDSMANKGFIATQVFVTNNPNEFVWVINTHTYAQSKNVQDSMTRLTQFQQIKTFVDTLPATNPVLIMGDLNVIADEDYPLGLHPNSDYAQMRSVLTDFSDISLGLRYITSTWFGNAYNHQWGHQEPEQRLDYILVRQGSTFGLDWQTVDLVNSLPNVHYTTLCTNWALPSSIVCHYSDHFGLKANLKFRQR